MSRAASDSPTTEGELQPDGCTEPASPQCVRRWRVAALLLTVYTVWLVYSACADSTSSGWLALPLADFENSARLTAWCKTTALAALWEAARFLPLGLLLPLLLKRGQTFGCRLLKWLAAFFSGVAIAAIVRGLELGEPPGAAHLLLPAVGCFVGVCAGTRLLRGFAALLWFVPQMALVLLLVSATGVWLFDRCLEPTPAAFETPEVTSAEKRRVVNLIRRSPRQRLNGVEARHVRLADADLNLLLAWANSLGTLERKARVRLGEDRLHARASLRVALPYRGLRYVNLQFVGRLNIDGDALRLRLERLHVGRVSLPQWLLGSLSPQLESFVGADANVRTALDAIHSVEIEPGAVNVAYETEQFDSRVLPALIADFGAKPDVVAATRVQVRLLIETVPTLPRGEARFGAILQTAFALARERSIDSEPAFENRAALYALAILYGDHRLEPLIGPVLNDELRRAARENPGRCAIRGRHDWTRHFFVSAAATALSSAMISNMVGLLKEELDAGRGGSGFSFSDLLADRAGTRFALAAIRDESSARAMQERLNGDFRIDEFFPAAADLPEGIPAAELESRYGGVGGAEYKAIIDEIERRLSACAALR